MFEVNVVKNLDVYIWNFRRNQINRVADRFKSQKLFILTKRANIIICFVFKYMHDYISTIGESYR